MSRKLLVKISKLFPDFTFKNKIKCFYYNLLERNKFKIYYKNKHYIVKLKDQTFLFNENPHSDLLALDDYERHYNLKKDDVVVDAGAHIGVFTIIASKLVGDEGKVIAFEPDTENYKKLLKNIKLNKLKNVITSKKGLWSKKTKLKFSDEHTNASSIFFDKTVTKNIIEIPVVSLDEELKKLKIKKLDFIKMDIEGAEIEAIKGSKNILKTSSPKIAIASYHLVDGKETCFELEKLFKTLNYKAKTEKANHLTTYASKSNL